MRKYKTIIVLVNLCVAFVTLKPANKQEDNYSFSRHIRQIKKKTCTLPPHPQNGFWSLVKGKGEQDDKVPIASVLVFECWAGYKLSSNFPSVCLGYWSSPVPECEKLCAPLYPTDTYDLKCSRNGKETECKEATHGTNLEYECKTFYETPFGFKKTLFCENGKWDSTPVCQPECGKKIDDDTEELIYGSKPSKKIEYPWVAAIYQLMDDSYQNICGGSILSQKVVLTAAHCVTDVEGNVLLEEDFMVGAGKLYRSYMASEDTDAQYSELDKIIVPHEYEADFRKYAEDIAMLVLKDDFFLSKVVQPLCFRNIQSIHLHPGSKGVVSGWGLAEGDRPSEVLRSLVIPYKYETVCAEELPPEWADRYNLEDKMCAGFINKSTSVCKGDSGAGLAFKYREDNRYYVHGIVSVGHKMEGVCNIQQNSIYTKVVSYYDLVNRIVTTYTPTSRDCLLPPYPKNGKWTTNEWDWKPGDIVFPNTTLTVICDKDYKASSAATIECSASHKMPKCEKLCEKLDFSYDVVHDCSNKDFLVVDCAEGIDETFLHYQCPPKYSSPFNTSYGFHVCLKGSWRPTKPECIRDVRDCGKKEVGSEMEHPWNAAIYTLSSDTEEKYKYVCGGTLVSEYVIITDARCISDEQGNVLRKEDYAIAVGKLYGKYEDPRDTRAQFSNLSAVTVHPKYKSTRANMYNIALLIASSAFQFNSFVQPACLIDNDTFSDTYGETVAGWRFAEDNSSEKIEALEIAFPFDHHCEDLTYFSDFPVGMTCGAFINESLCLAPEDSGKGVIGILSDDERYYLQNIVNYYNGTECRKHFWLTDLHYYSSFVDIAIY